VAIVIYIVVSRVASIVHNPHLFFSAQIHTFTLYNLCTCYDLL
jgi:hypothetical protein